MGRLSFAMAPKRPRSMELVKPVSRAPLGKRREAARAVRGTRKKSPAVRNKIPQAEQTTIKERERAVRRLLRGPTVPAARELRRKPRRISALVSAPSPKRIARASQRKKRNCVESAAAP